MHTKTDTLTPLCHAVIRSTASLPDDQLSRITMATWQRLADQIDWGAILADLTHGVSDEARAAIEAALTTEGDGLSLEEKRLFHDFQKLSLTVPERLVWNSFTNTLLVDDKEYRVPQTSHATEKNLLEMCPGLTASEIGDIRNYIRETIGPWSYYGQVERFERHDSRIWAMNDLGERLAPIVTLYTPSEFMALHHSKLETLHPETQKTLAFALSMNDNLLLDRALTLTFSAEEAHPALAVVSFIDDGEKQELLFTRPQTSNEFLETVRSDTFNFDLSQDSIREELTQHIQSTEGPWNHVGLVRDFFVSHKGAVLCRLYNGRTTFIPISMPAGDFMTIYVDDNPAITPSGKGLLNRVVEMEDIKIIRGSIFSISGSAEDGVLMRGYRGRIAGAFFSPCDSPQTFFSDDPFLSERGKETLRRDLEENPLLPEWRLRGYARRFSETRRGVVIEHYDGNKRFVPFERDE